MTIFDTIAAVSTPYGVGGVALVRISGENAIEVGSRVCETTLEGAEARRAYYKKIISSDGHTIDDAVVTVFRAPNSFTGEDTVEICCHGGIKVTEQVLRAVISAGARPAEAGEFTRRAFISGKISLERAEAIGSLLTAKTSEQVKLFSGSSADALTRRGAELYDEMAALLADMYARIDFPDEDLGSISSDEIMSRLSHIADSLSALLDTYKCGRAISEGISTVICGRTNAGKSSLYNRLVGRDAAIVTDIEGTTRDTLEETVPFGRLTLRLTDTAGLRESDDAVERIGIGRAREKIDAAELILAVFDNSKELSTDDISLIESLEDKKSAAVAIINKCELESKLDRSAILRSFDTVVEISAKDGTGIDALTDVIEKKYAARDYDITSDALITTERQFHAVSGAHDSILLAIESFRNELTQDVCSVDVERAMSYLSEVGGKSVSEDVVSKIFSKFCVGK